MKAVDLQQWTIRRGVPIEEWVAFKLYNLEDFKIWIKTIGIECSPIIGSIDVLTPPPILNSHIVNGLQYSNMRIGNSTNVLIAYNYDSGLVIIYTQNAEKSCGWNSASLLRR
jgi:hypothetical protein